MHKLEELEYVLVHRGGRGQSFVYELLYDGAGRDGTPFLMGLIDIETLKRAYDQKKEHREMKLETPGSPRVAQLEPDRCEPESSPQGSNTSTLHAAPKKNGRITAQEETAAVASYPQPSVTAAVV